METQQAEDFAAKVRASAFHDLHEPVMNTRDGAAAMLGGLSGADWNAVAAELSKPAADASLPTAKIVHQGVIKCIEFSPGPADHQPLSRHSMPLCSGAASVLEMQKK